MTEEQPPGAGGVGPVGRVLAVALVVAFTWWVERAFKALFNAVT